MTQTEQALAFHNTLFKQQVESKTATIIDKTLGYGNDFTKFRQDGALFWDGGKLHASLTDKKKLMLWLMQFLKLKIHNLKVLL